MEKGKELPLTARPLVAVAETQYLPEIHLDRLSSQHLKRKKKRRENPFTETCKGEKGHNSLAGLRLFAFFSSFTLPLLLSDSAVRDCDMLSSVL